MRTKEEVENQLKECIEKRDFWRERLSTLKELEYPEQREQYEDNQGAWSQRVRTLEYVLGINDVI